jgi:serine/threonine protein phosphatase PrpC
MGTRLKLQMKGYFSDQILKDTRIFNSVVAEAGQEQIEAANVKVKTKDAESQLEVVKESDRSSATFTYPIDTDADQKNGRLYVEDRFVFDGEKRLLEVKRSFRMGSGAAGLPAWASLFGRLKKLEEAAPLETEDPVVRKFFEDVVLKLPEPVEGEEPSSSAAAQESLSLSSASLSVVRPPPAAANLSQAHLRRLIAASSLLSAPFFPGSENSELFRAGLLQLINGEFDGKAGGSFQALAERVKNEGVRRYVQGWMSLSEGDLTRARTRFLTLAEDMPAARHLVEWIDTYEQAKRSLKILGAVRAVSGEEMGKELFAQGAWASRIASFFTRRGEAVKTESKRLEDLFGKMENKILAGEADSLNQVFVGMETQASPKERELLEKIQSESFADGVVSDLRKGGGLQGTLLDRVLLTVVREKLIPLGYSGSARELLTEVGKSSDASLSRAGREEISRLLGGGTPSDQIDGAVSRFGEELGSPLVIGSLLVGSASFRLGQGLALNRLGALRFSRPVLSPILATASGIALEAPMFELTHRTLANAFVGDMSWKGEEIAKGTLRNILTFGAFRGSGLGLRYGIQQMTERSILPFGRYTAPILSHGGTLATLHGMNELERSLNLRPREGDYPTRFIMDGAFYLQMGLAGYLVDSTLGPAPHAEIHRFKNVGTAPGAEPQAPSGPMVIPAEPAPLSQTGEAVNPPARPEEGWSGKMMSGDLEPALLDGLLQSNQEVPWFGKPAVEGRGSFAMITTQGIEYGSNEDLVFRAEGAGGEHYYMAVDGIGGHASGDVAALLTGEAFAAELPRSNAVSKAWQLANSAIYGFNVALRNGSNEGQALNFAREIITDPQKAEHLPVMNLGQPTGSVAATMKVTPLSFQEEGLARAEFTWLGDARAMVLRRGQDGKWHWIYRTVDESLASQFPPEHPFAVVPGRDFERGGEGRTLAFMRNSQASVVVNALGQKATVRVKSTPAGEVPEPSDPHGVRPASELEHGILMREGDLALLASDGFWENFGKTQYILDHIEFCTTPEQVLEVLTRESHRRMAMVQEAERYFEEHPDEKKYSLKIGEKTYSLEKDQNTVTVYDEDGKAVDHYKQDNFSLIAYLHNPLKTAAGGTDSKPVSEIKDAPTLKVLKPGGFVISTGSDSPLRFSEALLLPGSGEVSAFTHEGLDLKSLQDPSEPPRNGDAFGFSVDPRGRVVLMVAGGLPGSDYGDLASKLAVEIVVPGFSKELFASLGEAFMTAHDVIRKDARGGQTQGGQASAVAVRVDSDGKVDTAMIGHARLWILRKSDDGYEILETQIPHSRAGAHRIIGNLQNTLTLNAHPHSELVYSALGYPGDIQLVHDSFSYIGPDPQTKIPNQVLETPLSVYSPDNPGERTEVQLRPEDCLLLMNHGTASLFDRTQLAETIRGQTTADRVRRAMEDEIHARLKVFQNYAFSLDFDPKQFALIHEGPFRGAYINGFGNVYPSPEVISDELMAHIAPTSVTALVYQYRPANKSPEWRPIRSAPPLAGGLLAADTPSVAAMFRALASGGAAPPLEFQVSKAGDRFMALDPNTPGQTRQGRHRVFIPDFGEVSAFTHEGIDKHVLLGHSSTPVNEDGYGFMVDAQGRPVLIVADGLGYYGLGDLASAQAVEGALGSVAEGEGSLGEALTLAHRNIQEQNLIRLRGWETSGREGPEPPKAASVASMVRIDADGKVEVGVVGDTRIWVLRPQASGNYRVFETYYPDSVVGDLMANGSLDSILHMNAHPRASEVSGLLGRSLEPEIVEEFGYWNFWESSPGRFQILNTLLTLPKSNGGSGERVPFALEKGDSLLLMSDGVAELFDPEQLARVIQGERTADGIRRAVERESFRLLALWRHTLELSIDQMAPLPDGRYIDSQGNLYSSERRSLSRFIGHVGPDNVTALVYTHGSEPPAEKPVQLSPGIRPTPPANLGVPRIDPRLVPLLVDFRKMWSHLTPAQDGNYEGGYFLIRDEQGAFHLVAEEQAVIPSPGEMVTIVDFKVVPRSSAEARGEFNFSVREGNQPLPPEVEDVFVLMRNRLNGNHGK